MTGSRLSVAGENRALAWERRVYRAAHPVTFPLALLLRRLGPAAYVPGIGHVVNDAALARAVISDTEHFSKNGPGSAGELITQVMGDYALLNLEGDAHRELRALLLEVLHPAAVHDLVAGIWSHRIDQAVAALHAGRQVDLAGIAPILTGQTMRRLLGLPARDDDAASLHTFALGERMVSVVRLRNGPLSPAAVRHARRQYLALTDAFAKASDPPPGSVISRLRALGQTDAKIRGVCAALLLTGTGTVSTAFPRLTALISDSWRWGDVADAGQRALMIEEGLRLITPSPVMLRSVERDTVIGGHRFRRGRRAAIMTYHAVRSFPGGERFRPGRPVPPAVRGLVFGAGIHHCIGYALATAELDLALERLSRAGPLRVRRREPARRVLIPRYQMLEVERAQ